ncbi:hypothetical protein HAX54_005191 [Datura stramonium]|uniref:Uncharacterized protein n=1 Tax=Datura stramonium TaxID=4076 RepID=A0ABS8TAN1_DATST|nr:hypothetical protein [Datura stramonium]
MASPLAVPLLKCWASAGDFGLRHSPVTRNSKRLTNVRNHTLVQDLPTRSGEEGYFKSRSNSVARDRAKYSELGMGFLSLPKSPFGKATRIKLGLRKLRQIALSHVCVDRNGLAKPINGSLRSSQNYEKGERSFVKPEAEPAPPEPSSEEHMHQGVLPTSEGDRSRKGIQPQQMRCSERCDYVAGEIKDMLAASQLRFLTRLRRDLENGNSETWGLIEREVQRLRPGLA